MLKQLLQLILEKLDERENKDSTVDNKVVQLIEEIGDLEIKHAKALADAERWGDVTDNSDWRMVEVNRIRRVIESKKRMIDTLKNR